MFNHAALSQELFLLKDVDIYPFLSTLGSLPKLLTHSVLHTPQFIRWQLVLFPGKSYNCELVIYIWTFWNRNERFVLFVLNKKRCLGVVLLNKLYSTKIFKWDSYWEVNVKIIADVSSCNKIQETLSGMWVL